MPMHIRTGAAWQLVLDPSIRVGGVYQPIENAWVMVNGTWEKFYGRTPVVSNISALVQSAPCDGGGSITVSWDVENEPIGASYDVEIEVTDSTFGTHGNTFFGVTSGDTHTFSLCPDSTGYVTVYMKDSGGNVVAQDTVFI